MYATRQHSYEVSWRCDYMLCTLPPPPQNPNCFTTPMSAPTATYSNPQNLEKPNSAGRFHASGHSVAYNYCPVAADGADGETGDASTPGKNIILAPTSRPETEWLVNALAAAPPFTSYFSSRSPRNRFEAKFYWRKCGR